MSLEGQHIVRRSCGVSEVNKVIELIGGILVYIFKTRKVNTIYCTIQFVPRFNLTGNLKCSIFATMSTFYGTNVSLLKRSDLTRCITSPVMGFADMKLVVVSNLKFII